MRGLITKAQFANIVGVDLSNLNGPIGTGKISTVKDKIDVGAPNTQLYMRNRMNKTPKDTRKPTQRELKETFRFFGIAQRDINALIKENEKKVVVQSKSKTIKDLQELALKKRIKKIEADTKYREIEIAEKEGKLVTVDGLMNVCFNYLDLLNRQMFSMIGRIVDYAINLARSQDDCRNDIIKFVEEEISSRINRAKKDIEKALA